MKNSVTAIMRNKVAQRTDTERDKMVSVRSFTHFT